jgi:putative solute:sodium symporter small subunit
MSVVNTPASLQPDPAALPVSDREAARRHWRATRHLTALLLAVWFIVGFGVSWFARDLDFAFFGWPFSFWVAAQGGTIVFVVLIVVYAWRMARHDRALAAALREKAPAGVGETATRR